MQAGEGVFRGQVMDFHRRRYTGNLPDTQKRIRLAGKIKVCCR